MTAQHAPSCSDSLALGAWQLAEAGPARAGAAVRRRGPGGMWLLWGIAIGGFGVYISQTPARSLLCPFEQIVRYAAITPHVGYVSHVGYVTYVVDVAAAHMGAGAPSVTAGSRSALWRTSHQKGPWGVPVRARLG